MSSIPLGSLSIAAIKLLGIRMCRWTKLKGATIDELVRHSNGCAIARGLMATGFIHVETLHVLGGDAAVTDVDSLKSEIAGP
jgi:hypothetical protein